MNKVSGWEALLNGAEKGRDEARAELERIRREIEAWIRHGEAVPPGVTTYRRDIVHDELRAIIAPRPADEDEDVAPEMTMTVPVRTLFDRGLWAAYCDASGVNEWAVNEGQLAMEDTVTVTESTARRIGII